MYIKFTKNPTGKYKLAYSEGDEVNMPQAQAEVLVQEGYAIEVKETPAPPAPEETETAAMKHPAAETTTAGPKKNAKK